MRARVLENDNLERDLKTGAIINTNTSAYNQALQRRYKQKMLDLERENVQKELQYLRETCYNLQMQIDQLKKTL